MRVGLMVMIPFWIGLIMALVGFSGCGALGVRSVDFDDMEVTFAEGFDFRFGMNAVDTVNDTRGVSPIKSYDGSPAGSSRGSALASRKENNY